MKFVIVHRSPCSFDEELPWEYTSQAFIQWVNQELIDQSTKEKSLPSLKEAIEIAISLKYQVTTREE